MNVTGRRVIACGVVGLLIFACQLARAEDVSPSAPSALTAFQALTENHFGAMQVALKVAAATEEARSGEWDRIKLLLDAIQSSEIPAAVWYARPDGSYFTAARGPETNSLKDREYFPGLMSGRSVLGALVVSKSTGEKSAIVAVPVMQDGETVGGVGASIFLKDLSHLVRQELGWSEEHVFFALNADRVTVLNWKQERIFLDPTKQNSPSMTEAMETILAGRQGVVEYEFGGPRRVAYSKSDLLDWWFAMGLPPE